MIEGGDATGIVVETHGGFEQRWNIVQTVLHGLVGLALVAGCLGVFGLGGPLSTRVATIPGTDATVTYDRFLRRGTESRVIVSVGGPVAGDATTILLGSTLLDRAALQRVTPEPTRVSAGPTYEFPLSQTGPSRIVLSLKPTSLGQVSSAITLFGQTISLDQIVWP